MKILYDFQIFHSQKFGGISRYFFDLINYLNQTGLAKFDIPIKYGKNIHLKNNPQLFSPPENNEIIFNKYHKYKYIKLIQKNLHLTPTGLKKNISHSKEYIKRGDYDVFHPTYYNDYFIDDIKNRKLVITIHDMISEIFPEHLSLSDRTIELKRSLINRANRIITVSNHTKKDLCNIYQIDPEIVDVVHLSCSFNIKSSSSIERIIDENYILYTGSRATYKNFYTFLNAIKPILLDFKNVKLVCTGPPFNKEEINFFQKLELQNYIKHIFATDEDLVSLYINAELFAFPSIYEGFGIPILEAFSCDCPCALSNNSCFPEIAGNAAAYFNPKDYTSIRECINNLLIDKISREMLAKNGRDRLKLFNIDRTANDTLTSYKRALETSS